MTTDDGDGNDKQPRPWEYNLRKYLLLLASLVATVTYTAGFTPPGGVWRDTDPAGYYLAGDPIIRHTSKLRYVAFFYSNATAFASSLVVIVLILILSVRDKLRSGNLGWLSVLRGFMVLDLLSLMGAYAAGTYRDRDVPVYTMVLAGFTVVYIVVFHLVLVSNKARHVLNLAEAKEHDANERDELRRERERPRKVLMLLATFAVSVTYLAGLNAPGGFWNHADGHHRAGDPILMDGRHERRLKIFVHLNSTAFFGSLLVIMQLLDKNLVMLTAQGKVMFRYYFLHTSIVVALLGLVGAYATGSSRDMDTTIFVSLLVGIANIPACLLLFQLILVYSRSGQEKNAPPPPPPPGSVPRSGQEGINASPTRSVPRFCCRIPCFSPPKWIQDLRSDEKAKAEARSLVLLLATLAATITYQAGLDPPGGLWDSDGDGYLAGDPILLTMNPRRFKAFFYCNSIAFVASLLAIILVKNDLLIGTHALEAAMILDLFGLIGAYAAGSCRDVSTSIYAMALAGAVLVYVVIHVVFVTLGREIPGREKEKDIEKTRKRLQLFAILAATITYQAGLTPPGGFRLQDDGFGHNAGDPALLYIFPRRYTAFFYCNSVSFMLSIAMIILLVNPHIYKPAIQSHAISVCTAAGMFSLVGAYAAGSTQQLRTSFKIFGLAATILVVVAAAVLSFVKCRSKGDNAGSTPKGDNGGTPKGEKTVSTKDANEKKLQKLHAEQKYLMLLGILGASVTYQVGLKPPGGMWQDDSLGHVAGNPIMHDNGRTRYLAFFYINSTSFVASVIVIMLLLLKSMRKDSSLDRWLVGTRNITIVLDLFGLLVAYAVGSCRSWKFTVYVFMLVFVVLTYIVIHVALSCRFRLKKEEETNGGNQIV